MCTKYAKLGGFISLIVMLMFASTIALGALKTQGIYLTQSTLENTAHLNYLIKRAKSAGITTFVIDLDVPRKRYQDNIALVKSNNISYVARIVIFPEGGTDEQIRSVPYWEKKYRLIETAVKYGADQIQLDYIRYKASRPASPENAKNILKVISFFKERLLKQSIPLQVDVFGISSFGESKHIGQNIKLFAQSVDTICPMVYPSHYEPFDVHVDIPYQTVHSSLQAIKKQFNNNLPFKLIPYIELSNYHYNLSRQEIFSYIRAQIKAAEDAGADGWYAWSPHNKYDNLFTILETR